tara:strand:+ start:256 stop:669 length:414 start_codon:yes stop_codon:yes gene_type:complete
VDNHDDLEKGTALSLDFSKLNQVGSAGYSVVPVVVQDSESGEVLIVAYANEEALRETLKRKEAVFFSTSRNEIWHKGATSGDTLSLVDVRVNCEQNSLLYLVRPKGQGACHTKSEDGATRSSCYYRSISSNGDLHFI